MDFITGASQETINGVKFTLIYNAASTFVEASAIRSVKSKSLRQVAARNRCGYCLRYVNDNHEFYYFSPKPGISFARQIEAFIEASNDPYWQEDIKTAMIIPLDRRVYIAEIENGEVIDESVLIINAARENINARNETGQAIFYFSGGIAKGDIDLSHAKKLENFDLLIKKDRESKAFLFGSLALLMTRSGLYHRAQLLCTVPALIALSLAAFIYLEYQAEIKRVILSAQVIAEKESARLATENRERTSEGEANHSASVNLINFLAAYKTAYALARDGVERVSWDRSAIKITGKSARFPADAVKLGKENSWLFRLADGGWVVSSNQAASADNKVTTESPTAMRQSLFSLAELTGGAMNITKTASKDSHEKVSFSLAFSLGVPAVLVLLAKEMRNKPYSLDTATCQFSKWRPVGCQITMTVKYQK